MTFVGERTVVGAVLDLLSFSGSGNYNQFSRCFKKVCVEFSFGADDKSRQKFRQFAFHHLRSVGYIDVKEGRELSRWHTTQPVLVEARSGVYIAIANSGSLRSLVSAAPPETLTIHEPEKRHSAQSGVAFYPVIVELDATEDAARKIAELAGFAISARLQWRLPAILPRLESVSSATLESVGSGDLFEPGSAHVLETDNREWQPFSGLRPSRPGLFRSNYEFGSSRYFIAAVGSNGKLSVSDVRYPEWAFVLSLFKMGKCILLEYESATQKLRVPRVAARYPVVLERGFHSGALTAPRIIGGWRVFDRISEQFVRNLTERFPVFEVKRL